MRFVNYSGDVRHIIGEVKGPNLLDEVLTAVTADYDEASDTTRVGFAFGVHKGNPQEGEAAS
jgi:hypothetical protein